MEAAEGEAVVEQGAAVLKVGCADRRTEFVAERLADRQIDAGVVGQVRVRVRRGRVRIAVDEAGAVVDVGGSISLPRQRRVEADVERVALIVVDRRVARRDVALRSVLRVVADQATGDGAALLGDLVGVGEVRLTELPDAR